MTGTMRSIPQAALNVMHNLLTIEQYLMGMAAESLLRLRELEVLVARGFGIGLALMVIAWILPFPKSSWAQGSSSGSEICDTEGVRRQSDVQYAFIWWKRRKWFYSSYMTMKSAGILIFCRIFG